MIDPSHALAGIRESRFAPYEKQLVEMLEPSIRIGVMPVRAGDLALGASRFGGVPDLPPGHTWPRFGQRPLAMVAQLNLAELAPLDAEKRLPAHGWLAFFFDTCNETPYERHQDMGHSWRVLYFDCETDQLQRTEPSEPREKRNEFRCCAAGFRSELTLPSFGSALLASLPLGEDDRQTYEDLVFSLHASAPLARRRRGPLGRLADRLQQVWIGNPIHRVLGHPEFFQLDPRIDWQRLAAGRSLSAPPAADDLEAASDWLLLLQVDTYRDGPVWMWGDNCTLYFGIHKSDLAERNFDAVQWTVECA